MALRFKEKSNHMLILDHMFIDFGDIAHPPCLFRTTLLFGPLEYYLMKNKHLQHLVFRCLLQGIKKTYVAGEGNILAIDNLQGQPLGIDTK